MRSISLNREDTALLTILFIAAITIFVCLQPKTAAAAVRADLVKEVEAGKRKEAKLSWWGYDKQDSTDIIQRAIKSGVAKLYIDAQDTPWYTRPLEGVSNQQIIFERGAEIAALPGAYERLGDCLLTYSSCSNVVIRGPIGDKGKTARFSMRKADYQSSNYEKSEWRHGLAILACKNVLIQDIAIERTGGDGIYLGAAYGKGPNDGITIRRVDCNENHRQGISVITANNLLIEDCLLRNTSGTAPEAGIDYEPNGVNEVLSNCVIRRCIAEGNKGSGYLICPQAMNPTSKPISIIIDRCVAKKNHQHALQVCSKPQASVSGVISIRRFEGSNDQMAGLAVQFSYPRLKIELTDVEFRNEGVHEDFFTPIYLQDVGTDSRALSSVVLKRVTVFDDVERSVIWERSYMGTGADDVTGDITLIRKGRKSRLTVNRKLLRQISEAK